MLPIGNEIDPYLEGVDFIDTLLYIVLGGSGGFCVTLREQSSLHDFGEIPFFGPFSFIFPYRSHFYRET